MPKVTRHTLEPLHDTVIFAGGASFNVHRIIMCNCSIYFEALFCRHTACTRTHFAIPDVSAEVMEVIIDFAYTGSVTVTEDNVQQLFIAADFFIITDIVEACIKFVEENLTPENCIGVRRFAIFCPQLQHKAHFLLTNKFEEVVSSEEFLQLTWQELSDMLDSDDINVNEEKTVYEAIVRWIDHAPVHRTTYLAALLLKARLALCSIADIKSMMSNPYLRNNTQCVQIIINALQLKYRLLNATPPMTFCSNYTARPRLPNAVMFAIGGWCSTHVTNIIEVYDIRADYWLNITDHQESPRGCHGTVFHNGFIYCIGGSNGEDACNNMRKFDVKRCIWLEAAPMNHCRCYVSVAALGGFIYALGGFDGNRRLRTAERYRPEINQWSLIASMHDVRSDCGCAVFNNKIYICGGFNGKIVLQSCEFYCPKSNQWTRFADMRTRRSGNGVILYDSHIYVLGGYNGLSRLRSVEAYNPRTNEWHQRPCMSSFRSNFGIEVINNKLFVMGGYNGIDIKSFVEYYSAKTNKWSRACPMGTARCGVSCCVLSNYPNLKQYTMSRDSLPHLEGVQNLEESVRVHLQTPCTNQPDTNTDTESFSTGVLHLGPNPARCDTKIWKTLDPVDPCFLQGFVSWFGVAGLLCWGVAGREAKLVGRASSPNLLLVSKPVARLHTWTRLGRLA
ncbi:kelch-like protein 10 [Antennarius striatus]|uniref:kelch-like protein 10 n=1 Tax=Antennarius striatus TaxID=241820 RepID=UPI0035B314A4